MKFSPSLKNLKSLRILQVDHCHDYPLDILAKNPALGSLTHLMLHPHGLDHEDAYLRLEHLRALIQSKHLTSLRHLRLCCSDLGDEGCSLLRGSDLLGRLTALDFKRILADHEGQANAAGDGGGPQGDGQQQPQAVLLGDQLGGLKRLQAGGVGLGRDGVGGLGEFRVAHLGGLGHARHGGRWRELRPRRTPAPHYSRCALTRWVGF